jgi:hypothetical protein
MEIVLPTEFWVALLVLVGSGRLAWERVSGSLRPWEPLLQGFLLMQAGLVFVLPQLLARPEVMLGLLIYRALFSILVVVAVFCWIFVSLLLGACWGWLVVLLADQLAAWRSWPPHPRSPLVRAIQELRGLDVPEVAIEQIVWRQFVLPRARVRAILETGRGQ